MNQDAFAYSNPAVDEGVQKGPLAGVRVAVSPGVSVRGWPADAGSRALEGFTALENASAVERLVSAGANIEGYSKMAELGFGLDGDTGASLAASNSVDAVLAVDALGEVRVGSAEARKFGFKPTAGIISRYGLIGLAPSLESLGVIAREVGVIREILRAVSGADDRDPSLSAEFPDFAQTGSGAAEAASAAIIPHSLAGLSPAETAAFEAALGTLRGAGFVTREIEMQDYALFNPVHGAIAAVEASSSAGKYDGVRFGHRAAKADDWNQMYLKTREESFGPLVKALLFQGAYFQFDDYAAFENACRIRGRLVRALDDILNASDFIVLPARSLSAPAHRSGDVSQVYERFVHTLAANVAGLPSVSIPGILKADGEDLGLQLVGRRLGDAALLDCAARLASAHTEDSRQ